MESASRSSPDANGIGHQISAAHGGSAQALGGLLDAFRSYLLLIANAELDSGLRQKVGASDLVQETYLRAQKAFPAFQGRTEAELRAWLRQIMVNHCRNVREAYQATGKREIRREVEFGGDTSAFRPAVGLATDCLSPSGYAMRSEEAVQVAQALASLPADYQQVVRLRSWENLSFDEIGDRIGRSGEAARKLWFRAIQQLATDWEQTDGHCKREPDERSLR